MNIRILYYSSVSPILFLVYINRVFDLVNITLLKVTTILFIDNLGFLANGK